MQKNAKFSSAGGSAPRPPCLGRLGALPPNPQPPAAGDEASKPPLASGGWGLSPQTPKTAPPIANFWLRACFKPKILIKGKQVYEVLYMNTIPKLFLFFSRSFKCSIFTWNSWITRFLCLKTTEYVYRKVFGRPSLNSN